MKSQSSRQDAMKIARYLGCRGAHQGEDGSWMPCADAETLMRLSTEAESDEWLERYEKDVFSASATGGTNATNVDMNGRKKKRRKALRGRTGTISKQ